MSVEQDLADCVKAIHSRLTVKQLGALLAENYEIEQVLGKALGYPRAFPDVGEMDDDSVVVAPHTPITLAMEAAECISKLRKELEDAKRPAPVGA